MNIWERLNQLVVYLLLLALAVGIVVWYLPVIKHNEALRKEILHFTSQVRQEEEIARRLEARIKAIKNDPKTVERVVREKLGYVKPGETMIRFVDPASMNKSAN